MDGDRVEESTGRPLGADQDADRVGAEKATMQLLHQTCKSRIERLNDSGVTAGSSGKCGDQQRFNASTRSDTSSVRQKRYDDNRVYPAASLRSRYGGPPKPRRRRSLGEAGD